MLGYFPRPLPDELFFSIVVRFALHTGMPDTSSLVSELTGNQTLAIDTRLANDLGHLVANLPPGHGATIDEFLDQHTLLPLYGSVLTAEQTRQLRTRAVGPTGRSQRASKRLTSGRQRKEVYQAAPGDQANDKALALLLSLPVASGLRYCPQCAAADREAYGESYWHRIHQVRGIYICAQHGVALRLGRSAIPRTIAYRQLAGVSVRALRVDSYLPSMDYERIDLDSPAGRLQTRLITEVAWLLARPSAQTPLLSLRRRALSAAMRSGLVRRGRYLEVTELSIQASRIYMFANDWEGPKTRTFNRRIGTDAFWREVIMGRILVGDPVPWLLMTWASCHTLESLLQPR